jgi:hypothetical protein
LTIEISRAGSRRGEMSLTIDTYNDEQTDLPGPIEGSYPNGQPYNTSNVIDIATPTSSIIYRAREREGCTNQIHSIIILVFFELHIQC